MESRFSKNETRKIRPEIQKVLDKMWQKIKKDLKMAELIEQRMSK